MTQTANDRYLAIDDQLCQMCARCLVMRSCRGMAVLRFDRRAAGDRRQPLYELPGVHGHVPIWGSYLALVSRTAMRAMAGWLAS